MRLFQLLPVLFLTLVSSCGRPGVRVFWDTHDPGYEDIRAAENQFADFAELAANAPESEALPAIDALYDKLLQDTVGYYLYAEWSQAAFYNPLSPCRSAALFSKAVDRIVEDSVLQPEEMEPYIQKREWIRLNQVGAKAIVPGLPGLDGRTLVLVLDLGCPSCRKALETLAQDPEWKDAHKVAVGMGIGPNPQVPGWEYVFPQNAEAVFDMEMTPFYFVIAPDGLVESGYELALK